MLIIFHTLQNKRSRWKLQLKKQNSIPLNQREFFQNCREIVFLKAAGMTNGKSVPSLIHSPPFKQQARTQKLKKKKNESRIDVFQN